MNLEKMNHWLTLLANIGVLVGMVFLVIEVRQNTIATEQETVSNFQNGFAAVELMIASNPEFGDLLAKGRNGEKLTPAEFVRLQAFYRNVLRTWQTNISRYDSGGLSSETWEGTQALMSQTFLEDQGLLKHWHQNRNQFNSEFNNMVNTILNEQVPNK